MKRTQNLTNNFSQKPAYISNQIQFEKFVSPRGANVKLFTRFSSTRV